ncbi:MAG TPA: 3-deoxy-7-phosphoheptulonate synthase [Ktedonosporobacter sp.]|jgi:3-deoxy-7-phosphoheptulonate synthase|nr:3-deoxy-7-phosphoheptulonate synthase [Ktedonosporobacter sp.]
MILILRAQIPPEELDQALVQIGCIIGLPLPPLVKMEERYMLALDAAHVDEEAFKSLAGLPAIERVIPTKRPYKLVSRELKSEPTVVMVGDGITSNVTLIGGIEAPTIIAGPCAVESREQLFATALAVKKAGAHILRGGAFKPRTSPYQFQGLGVEGLALLAEAREQTGLPIVTEVMEPDMVEVVAGYADMLQIGARNMQNYPLLTACGRQQRPVMLKRGLSATVNEWLLAAEYIVAAGNPNVVLCERGIRSYDPQTRNVLDLTVVPLLRELTHLPVIVDPSHATGKSTLVPAMARASIAVGGDGIMVEVHSHPEEALCDGQQAITPHQLSEIIRNIRAMVSLSFEEGKDVTHGYDAIYPHFIVR